MKVISIQSGSNGNSIFIDADKARFLIDAGVSAKQVEERLALYGYRSTDITGVLISHDHSDHMRSAGIYQRKWNVPLYVTSKTINTAIRRYDLGVLRDLRFFKSGDTLQFETIKIETIPTPHDATDGVAFVIDTGRSRLGVLTDLGHVFDGLRSLMPTLDAAILESNYDPKMLALGRYPVYLKKRIQGPRGHLSNFESAHLVRDFGQKLKWVCLAHLSEENNEPDLALSTHKDIVGHRLPIHIAKRYESTGVFEI